MTDPRIDLLLSALARAFEGRSWHGPTLKGSFRGVKLKQACARPGKARNSIRDLVYHCAYWKLCARRWLLEEAGQDSGPKFQRSPVNFPKPEDKPTDKQWASDKRMLAAEHKLLVEAVTSFPRKLLTRKLGNGMTCAELIQGVAAHDLYHAGQITLLKRLI